MSSLPVLGGASHAMATPLVVSPARATIVCERVVLQKWRWPCLHRPPKGIAVDKQAKHDVMHLRRFRAADRLADSEAIRKHSLQAGTPPLSRLRLADAAMRGQPDCLRRAGPIKGD